MKKAVWTSITAIICVVLVSLSLKDGIVKVSEAKVEAASVAAEAASSAAEQNAGSDELVLGDGMSMDGESSDAGSSDAGVPGESDGSAGSTDGTTPDAGASNGAEAEKKGPSTVDEVLATYNNAINKVISEKAGYSKKRTTTLNTLEGGALLEIKLVVDMVNDFLGVGTTDYKNEKGKAEFLSKASLTKNDLKSIDIKTNDGVYTITLGLKDGQSQANASGASDTCPLSRSGLFTGKGDKKAFDYKSSENIHTAINGVENTSAESANEQVTNAKIVATIEAETGKLTSLTVTWDWAVQLANVKYTVVPVKKADGTATSKVEVSDFKW